MTGRNKTTSGSRRWSAFGVIFAVVIFPGFAAVSEGGSETVLRSRLAGGWYPADANELNKQVEGFFRKAKAKPLDNVIALIEPHAGYRYSGQVAAEGLKTLNRQYKRVIVIGPSHRAPMEQMLSVPMVTHYETPLGRVPLDVDFIKKLLKFGLFRNLPYAHKYEHSVQIQVPLLQYRLKDFKLVPIVAGDCSLETVRQAGRILAGLIDDETLVIASSDFVHYGPRYNNVPFKQDIPQQLRKLDMGAYELIADRDVEGFLKYTTGTAASVCGRVPIAILLSMLGDCQVHLVKYATSGELTGDYTNSVSYLSVAFTGRWKKTGPAEPQQSRLSEEDKQRLLALARKTIAYALKNHRLPEAQQLGVEITAAMRVPRAAFVTLKKDHRLRGCIGDIFPQRPLYRSVMRNAINAAFGDRRFPPLQEDELDAITIEISALTSPEPVDSPEQIRLGTDGIVLRKNGHSAVYLPQVAPEQGWDLEQTLSHLSQKAGLDTAAWKSGASFLVFQAEVFGEQR